MLYKLFVPAQAVGAGLVYFDLFSPSGTGRRMKVLSVLPVVSGAAAVTGTLAVDLFLTRTTAVGTGGTAATSEGTSLTAATISAHNHNQPFAPTWGSARLTPSGGATAGAVLSMRSVFTEETADAAYARVADMARTFDSVGGIVVPNGTGIRVVQGAVASVGNIGFDVLFHMEMA
jgi:hypothetical protein